MALDRNSEIFVIHVVSLKALKMTIHFSKAAQVIDNNLVQVVTLK